MRFLGSNAKEMRCPDLSVGAYSAPKSPMAGFEGQDGRKEDGRAPGDR